MGDSKMETDANESFWASILSEIRNQRDTKLPSNKSVLVLGDNASGKSSLIAELHDGKVPKKGFALEYNYIKVRDEKQDEDTFLSVWILHNDGSRPTNLLQFALNENNFSHTLVILTVSMATPWNWMDQLQHWMKVLTEHVAGLNIAPEEKQQCQARLTTAWQNYCETIEEPYAGTSTKDFGELDALSLPESVLTNNLGLDIVIVVTKTDHMFKLTKKFNFRHAHFDFMEQCVRRFCLMYGAALIYTSVKKDKNCDLLYQYLKHRIYGLPFRTSALVVEKDAVLIPAGWDSMNKINILNETLHSFKLDDTLNFLQKMKKLSSPSTVAAPATAEVVPAAGDPHSDSSSASMLSMRLNVEETTDTGSTSGGTNSTEDTLAVDHHARNAEKD